ncbi:hypothetical protein [Lysobacter sp. CFH 32150]|uniref:hypothetical protein n=1 Tax=Lysobacter sp. CFH 32150 TaxID=2927128 RepID=UPI001FA6F904|nr:hypothetical protein [Lysobacter sp. CFH 32150]MCI4569027.1 hypothetical protein [Lysobacter sp. CFH 32150]
MRIITILILAFALMPQSAVAQHDSGARAPFVVEHTYWIKPGKELQFIGLFEKSRVPLLRAKIKEGRVLWVRLSRPHFNAINEQWDLRVTVAWRDADSAVERTPQAKGQLAMEQQIMEELIMERTDVPIQEWSLNDVGA